MPKHSVTPEVTVVQPRPLERAFRTEVFDAPDVTEESLFVLSDKTLQEQAAGRAATKSLRPPPPEQDDEQPKETP